MKLGITNDDVAASGSNPPLSKLEIKTNLIVRDGSVVAIGGIYTQNESGMLTDWSTFQEIPSLLYKSIRVPIYRKNDKFRFKVKIDQPFSATIVSASWDGRYNTRRHVRK